jgi:uncharacterized protein (DUF2252 family)
MNAARMAEPGRPLTVAERMQRGKTARTSVPRSSHGDWAPAPDRPDPIALLEQQAVTRVPDLVPIRHGRMAASPFAYFRGAALPMAADLAATRRLPIDAQLCGDAHLSNFGGFASPDRVLVFDVNDFDETHPGPFDWDVKRLAASLEIAGRSLNFSPAERRAIVQASVAAYRNAMRTFATQSNLDVWYARLDVESVVGSLGPEAGKAAVKNLQRNIAKAKTKDRLKAAAKLTREVDGQLHFISEPPLIVPVEDVFNDQDSTAIESTIHDALRSYRRSLTYDRRQLLESYRYVHLARKVVGVGSVGTRAWVALFVGRDNTDPLFLQVKEAEPSVLEPYLGKSRFANHGQRVVEGQRLMQAASDIFLGFEHVNAVDGVVRDYYMRQLWDWKASADIEAMSAATLRVYAQICGWTLARAHARSGDRVAIAAYLGNSAVFDRALGDFASRYADQNALDHQALLTAIEQGRVAAQMGI